MLDNPFRIDVAIDIEKFFLEVPLACQKAVMLQLFRALQWDEVGRAIFRYKDIKLFEGFQNSARCTDVDYGVIESLDPQMLEKIERVAEQFVKKLVAFLELVDEDDEAKEACSSPTVRKVLYAAFILFDEEHVEEAIAQYRREVNLPVIDDEDEDDEEEAGEETDQAEDRQTLP